MRSFPAVHEFFFIFFVYFSIRKLLSEAHASAWACSELTVIREQHDPRMFVVETLEDVLRSDTAIFSSLSEIDGGAAMRHAVSYRFGLAYTFVRGGFINFSFFGDRRQPNDSLSKFKQSSKGIRIRTAPFGLVVIFPFGPF